MNNLRNKAKGFSLIELMIVVGLILVIAAIAIPNLLRPDATNEASAVGSLRAINAAMIAYNLTYPTVGYASQLNVSAPLRAIRIRTRRVCLTDSWQAERKVAITSRPQVPEVLRPISILLRLCR